MPTLVLRRSVKKVSRQTPASVPIRSRRPTRRNPYSPGGAKLGKFSAITSRLQGLDTVRLGRLCERIQQSAYARVPGAKVDT